MSLSTLNSVSNHRQMSSINCMTCLRDISRYRKRSKCVNCCNNQTCKRCMINGWCKRCYIENRMICPICNNAQSEKRHRCISCNIGYCDDCGIQQQCKSCFILNEQASLIEILSNIDIDTVIISKTSINIIAEYCIGYIIQCGNKREECPNTILFENKFEFLTNKSYHKYQPKIDDKDTVEMYHGKWRIFCMECSMVKLEPCLNGFGGNCANLEICGMNKYGNICGDHRFCNNCNQRELYRECYRPKNNGKSIRKWVYYTARATKIIQCTVCNKDFCKECIKYEGSICKRCGDELRIKRISMIEYQKSCELMEEEIVQKTTFTDTDSYNIYGISFNEKQDGNKSWFCAQNEGNKSISYGNNQYDINNNHITTSMYDNNNSLSLNEIYINRMNSLSFDNNNIFGGGGGIIGYDTPRSIHSSLYLSQPNSMESPTNLSRMASAESLNDVANFVEDEDEHNKMDEIIDNEKRRTSNEYKQECIARLMIGRAPILRKK